MGLKLSRFGSGYFLGCTRYPTCMFRTSVLSGDVLDSSDDEEGTSVMETPSNILGVDPVSGLKICMKTGPYGRYVQMGSGSKKQKPKRSAIPKDMKVDEITLTDALELLKYPVELGKHPETGAPVLLSVGQYGHFLRCRGVFVSLPKEISPDNMSLEEAVGLLKSKHVSKRGRKPQAQDGTSEKLDGQSDKTSTSVKKNAKAKPTKAKMAASGQKLNSVSSEKVEKAVAKEVEKKPVGENGEQGKANGIVQGKRPRGRPRKARPEIQLSASAEGILEIKGR